MDKKYIRHQPIISKNSDQSNDDLWQQRLEKEAVHSRKMDESLFHQITQIMGRKSKYSTVQDAVDDMKKRSGLTDYLNKESNSQEVTKKVAQLNNDPATPTIIKEVPIIAQTIQNYIRDTRGTMSLPAILEKIKSIHQKDIANPIAWDDPMLYKYIAELNLLEKQRNPNNLNINYNLGKNDQNNDIDSENSDFFSTLNVTKY